MPARGGREPASRRYNKEMDTLVVTAPEVARELGVSLPTAHHVLDRAGVPRVGRGHTRTAPAAVLHALVAERGAAPVSEERSAADLRVLAALSRSPLGGASARTVADKAGISPTTASRSLQNLCAAALVERRDRVVASGRARHERRWFANVSAWPASLTHEVRRTRLPRRRVTPSRLPRDLRHLFWNADVASLDPSSDGSYMAGRLLEASDVRAWRWTFANIAPRDIRTAMGRRGISPRTRALAENWLAYAP